MNVLARGLLCCGVALAFACGGDDGGKDDAGRDAVGEAGPDDGADLGEEVADDTARDPGGDPASDPSGEATADPGEDPGMDPGDDAGVDVPSDAVQDPGADPAPDPAQDPGQDLAADSGNDVAYPPGTPILDRAVDLRFDCSVSRTSQSLQPRTWTVGAHPLVTTSGGDVFLARVESAPAQPFDPADPQFLVSTFDANLAFGSPVEVPSSPESVYGVAAAPLGDGFLLAWSEGTLKTSVRDSTGAAVGGAKTLAGLSGDYQSRLSMAPLGQGFGLAYDAPEGYRRKVVFARLDGTGAVVGKTLELAVPAQDYDEPAPQVASDGSRHAILWQEAAADRGHVYFAAVDADGTVAVPRRRVSKVDEANVYCGRAAFSRTRNAILPAGDGWLAAWTEVRRGESWDSPASGVVKIARLSADGESLEEAPVRAARDNVDEVEPVLLPFQGAAALLWSSGTHISICAGCHPDNSLFLVLLDPATLVPVGDLLTLPPTTTGLLDASLAAKGDDLLAAFQLFFHVSHEAGAGVLHCPAR